MESQEWATGLLKKCPRCGAVGEVKGSEIRGPDGSPRCVIIWPKGKDTNVSLGDVFDRDFGCGYDP